MYRRIFSISSILSVLMLLLALSIQTVAWAQTATATPTPTGGCNPPAPTYYTTVTPSATSVNTGDQIDVTVTTNVGIATFYLSVIDTSTGQVQSQTDPIFSPAAPASQNPGGYTAHWTLTAVRAGTVYFSGRTSGEIYVCINGSGGFTWGGASGTSGNVTVSGAPVATFTPTPTATITKTPTATRTPTRTPTPGSGGTCSPVDATISAPFTKDGAGTFCWQSSNLGSYINNWNMTSLTINGVNFTNVWASSGSYPAQIGGYWYVAYNGPYPWSHFEAK